MNHDKIMAAMITGLRKKARNYFGSKRIPVYNPISTKA
jgi:hypothetical protein